MNKLAGCDDACPIVQATCEEEVAGYLEPWGLRLPWAEVVPPHSRLGEKARPCLKQTPIRKNIWGCPSSDLSKDLIFVYKLYFPASLLLPDI